MKIHTILILYSKLCLCLAVDGYVPQSSRSTIEMKKFIPKKLNDIEIIETERSFHFKLKQDNIATRRCLCLVFKTSVNDQSLESQKSPPTPPYLPCDNELLEASKDGDLELVKKIVSLIPDMVNTYDVNGRYSTPLHYAAGYNRVGVVEFLLNNGADVHAKDKGGLVPLHNACSYGHYEVTELLVKHGATVNVSDLWKFTPLHEAAAKGKYEIVKLLLKHGADPSKKNRDGHTPLDLVKEGDQDVVDLLRGDSALLDAAKKGNLSRVQKLLTTDNINCRDSAGRNSTPLHLAAGYNNLEVAEFLLEQGADVNAQDKGGLIPLHNASSYGHLDIAALLIKYQTIVNATDKWGYTPLHEAAQKGRTQLCALLLAHGADPTLKNQEGQTPLDLSTADDVKCLLQDAMPSTAVLPTTTKLVLQASSQPHNSAPRLPADIQGAAAVVGAAAAVSTVVMPSGAAVAAPAPTVTALVPAGAGAAFPKPHPGDGSMDFTKTGTVLQKC